MDSIRRVGLKALLKDEEEVGRIHKRLHDVALTGCGRPDTVGYAVLGRYPRRRCGADYDYWSEVAAVIDGLLREAGGDEH